MNRTILSGLIFLILFSGAVLPQNPSGRPVPPDQQLERRAASLERLGRTEEAVNLYLEMLYRDPRNSNLYFRVSAMMPDKEFAPTLLQILDDILKQQPNNVRLAAEKGRLLYILDRKDEAGSQWQELIDKEPAERFTYTTVSNAMLQAGATQEAVDMLVQGRTALKDERAFAFELARIYAARHNYSQAGHEYLVHLDANNGMLDHIANQLIRMLENDGAYEALDLEFKRILATRGDHQAILLARAKILLYKKRYAECVEAVLSSDVSRETRHVFTIANELAADQAWESAAELYLYVSSHSQNKKEVGEALLQLAASYEHRLQENPAYESLSGYFPGNKFLEPDIRFVAAGGASLARTLKLYDSLQTLLPKTPEAFQASFNIAEIHLTVSGDIDRAVRGYEYIFDQAPNRVDKISAGLRMVDAWLVRGDTSRAIRTLEQVASRTGLDEDQPEYITSHIKILLNEGDLPGLKKELMNLSGAASPMDAIFNDGMELMALMEGNGGETDPALHLYFKAEQMVFQHKLAEAIQLLQSIDGDATTIADEAHVRAIQLLRLLGKTKAADAAMDAFLSQYPESEWLPNILVWRGEYLQYTLSEPAAAVPYYEAVIVNHPGYLEVQKVRIRLRQIIGSGS